MIIRFHSSYRTMHFSQAEWRLSLDLWDEWRDFFRVLWEQHAVDAALYQGGIAYQVREVK